MFIAGWCSSDRLESRQALEDVVFTSLVRNIDSQSSCIL